MRRERTVLPARQQAFTLLEVLVALAIVAVALAAAARAAQVNVHSVDALRTALLVEWLADNRLAEMRARRSWPPPGVSSGTLDMAGERLGWQQTVESTASRQFRRIEIRVWRLADETAAERNPAGKDNAYRRVSYLMRPT